MAPLKWRATDGVVSERDNVQEEPLQAILGMLIKARGVSCVRGFVLGVLVYTKRCYDALQKASATSIDARTMDGKAEGRLTIQMGTDILRKIQSLTRQAADRCSPVSRARTR